MSGIIGGAGSKSGVIGTTVLDYEEGIWNPLNASNSTGIELGSGNVTLSSTYNEFGYIKIGNVVYVSGRWEATAVSSPSGTMKMYGLPFTATKLSAADSGGGYWGGGMPNAYSVNAMTGTAAVSLVINTGTTYVGFYESTTTGHANMADHLTATTAFIFNAWYRCS